MSLKQDVLVALHAGEDHDSLLDLVRRHQALGMGHREAYEVLEQIWREFAFDKNEEGGALRDNLEYVMERVWFQTPTAG
jgi:hypothetical protein